MACNPHLIIEEGQNVGVEIHILNRALIIGRDSSSDHAIQNEKISRQHIRIFLKDGRWLLEDLKSKNYTRLNNFKVEPFQPQILADGDRIQLAGQVILRFHDPSVTVSETNSRVITSGLWLDHTNREVYINNRQIIPKLTKRHFAILELLYLKCEAIEPIATLDEISTVGWPNEYGISPAMIYAEIHRLRQRLAELEPDHNFIETIRDLGRKFIQKA